MGAFRTLEMAGPRIEDCLPGYGQVSLVIRQGKGGKARAADALAKPYRTSQRNRETSASWRRRVPVNLRPTPRVFPAPRVTETGDLIVIDSP